MPGLLVLAALAVATATLSGCSAGTPDPTPATAADPCPPATDDSKDAAVVTPAELCALDGQAWKNSAFTTVLNTPSWGETSSACDEARMTAFYDAWDDVQSQMTTFDLESDFSENARMLGGVGVAVILAPDATAPVALIQAEVDACLDGSAQTKTEHGAWNGVRGPLSGDDGEQLTWWAAGDGHWSIVQAYISDSLSDADAGTLESAFDTVLDAQAAHL